MKIKESYELLQKLLMSTIEPTSIFLRNLIMIYKIVRFAATLVLVGVVTIATWLGSGLTSLALSTEQIVKSLQTVPVFTIIDAQGAPLIAIDDKNKSQKVTGVFINQDDANKFFDQVQQRNPDIAKKVKVNPVSLGEIYKVAEYYQSIPESLIFAYVPTQKEVQEAEKIFGSNGQKYTGGVPLFIARGGQENNYLTIEQNSQVIIPMFFALSELQERIELFKNQKPELADTIKIEVIPLEVFIATLKESNDQNLSRFVLVPSEDTLKAAKSFGAKTTDAPKAIDDDLKVDKSFESKTTNTTPTTNK